MGLGRMGLEQGEARGQWTLGSAQLPTPATPGPQPLRVWAPQGPAKAEATCQRRGLAEGAVCSFPRVRTRSTPRPPA